MPEQPKLVSLLLDKISVRRELMLPNDLPLDLLAFSQDPELVGTYEFEFHDQRVELEVRYFKFLPVEQLLFVDRDEMERKPEEIARRIELNLGEDAREEFYREQLRDDLLRGFHLD